MTAPPEPRAASTLILIREGEGGAPEVFLVKRHGRSGFMANAHVFPGGKLDAADSADEVAPLCAGRSAEACLEALREPRLDPNVARGLFVAAARETAEEAGVLPGGATLSAKDRKRLLDEEWSFADLLRSLDTHLDLSALYPFARWVTPLKEKRRFDARFFLAVMPPDANPAHDERETVESAWWAPAEAVRAASEGEIILPPPTLVTLQWLSRANDVESCVAFADSSEPRPIQPRLTQDEAGVLTLALPGDPLHEDKRQAFDWVTRIQLEGTRWRSGLAGQVSR